ncbi:hypothetical protein PHAVU_009G042800 [Phaseolus vulgaris]|uniref:Uncharacterized protein n=1 Tax=Phaseolus vulgaris TaxID=3885 RepID=V7ASV4_PHAVU|nr:hypothetical protein PHAVU_009G042800g [Phaseolus vulgaris]ESW08405.1 hypothetical protein PHAVU_009G042800g [Phaseolus vulgaris]
MKVSCCLAIAHNVYQPSLTLRNINNSHVVSCHQNPFTLKERNWGFSVSTRFWPNHILYSVQEIKSSGSFVVGCGSWSLVRELEQEFEAEMRREEGGESGMGRYRHKCREGKGVVDMLECLEKEAIMGEDEGKDPMDYNRRAHIFHASSKIFQALKELNDKTL